MLICPPDPPITDIQPGLGGSSEWSDIHRGIWSPEETAYHVNYLELLASLLAIKASGRTLHYSFAVCGQYYNSEPYKSERGYSVQSSVSITIWTWCTERNITFQAKYFPGQVNSLAYEESRTVRDHCDWMNIPT